MGGGDGVWKGAVIFSLYFSSGLALIQRSLPKSALRKMLKYCEAGTVFSAV